MAPMSAEERGSESGSEESTAGNGEPQTGEDPPVQQIRQDAVDLDPSGNERVIAAQSDVPVTHARESRWYAGFTRSERRFERCR